jgi:hypothetical protein
MSNPLGILAGLAGIGANAASGTAAGMAEGEDLKRKLASQQSLDQLRVLDAMLKGQQLQAGATPKDELHEGIMYRRDPRTGQLTPVAAAPQRPPTDLQTAQTEAARARAKRDAAGGSKVIDQLEEKVRTGGLDALSPGERAVWNAHHKPATEPKEPASVLGLINKLNDPNTSPAERARAKKELKDYQDVQASGKENTATLLHGFQDMRGGPWVDRETGEVVKNISRKEFMDAGGNKRYKPITTNQQQSLDVLEGTAPQMIEFMKYLAPRILARYPGQNLAQLVENVVKGKLSDSEVREYGQMRNELTIELGRALSGTPAVRIQIMNNLEQHALPNTGDRARTAVNMLNNVQTSIDNAIAGIKGMKPQPYQGMPRTIHAVNENGDEADIKLAPYEPLPAGWKPKVKK